MLGRTLMIFWVGGLMIISGWIKPTVAHEPVIYHVSAAAGNDNNDGLTPTTPWRTLAKANALVQPGDCVLLYQGIYREPIAPRRSGAEQQRISYRAVDAQEVIIEGARQLIQLYEKSYITIEGLIFRNPIKGWGEIRAGHYNEIINNTFIGNGRSAETLFSGLNLFSGSSFNRLVGNLFYHWGEPASQWGDAVRLSEHADHNLIEGNLFINAGHSLLGIDTSFNIVRRNYFANNWQKGIDLVWRVNPSFALGQQFVARRNVIEENLFVGGRPRGMSDRVGPAIQLAAAETIIRRNLIVGQDRGGLYINGWSEAPHVYGNRIYHNTIINNGGIGIACLNFGVAGVDLSKNEFKNNLVCGNSWQSDAVQVRIDLLPRASFGPEFFAGYAFAGNGLSRAPLLDITSLAGQQSLAVYQQRYPQWMMNNFSAEPQFVNAAAGDYRLASGSPGIDAAVPLTATVAAGSGTVVPVVDVSYFTDGHGLKRGDRIRIGSNPPATILRIHELRQTLVTDTTLVWEAGDGVYLEEFDGQRPDVGAFESQFRTSDVNRVGRE
ncbi:MAG: right-handed parallel beta-helix repeat-containing protein [Acidobacteriota bacterium]|nr:right-handed parallel beta-helix repeat-containing protein [Blastocatellia bacterium]MDW8238434.1 right-handed parallel beta-helix repeat-containing protein [Acidobacteriota bacterium]